MNQSNNELPFNESLFDLAPGSELWRLTEYYRNMGALGDRYGHSTLALRDDIITLTGTVGLLATYPGLLYLHHKGIDHFSVYAAVLGARHVLSGYLHGINSRLERLVDKNPSDLI